jgi:hypothetical protein
LRTHLRVAARNYILLMQVHNSVILERV